MEETLDRKNTTATETPELADDLLRGADEIAEFLFGTKSKRRAVYYLRARTRVPIGQLGSMLFARRSKLMQYFEEQEGRSRSSN